MLHKKNVLKWIFQFLLSSFFAFVVVVFLNPRGSMGTQIQFIILRIPIAVTLGIVLADISIYTTRKFSFLASLASLVLVVPSFIFSLFIGDVLNPNSLLPKIITAIIVLCALILPSLVAYNLLSHLMRGKKSPTAKKSLSL